MIYFKFKEGDKMRGIWMAIIFILLITVVMPMILIKGCDVATESPQYEKTENIHMIKIYNTRTKKVEEIGLEEYIKGVVAAEMPAEFQIEALKAQAVAARTYALQRIEKYPNGHPDHPDAALCTGIHCQAWLSKDELIKVHSQSWMDNYWNKIEHAVDSTQSEVIVFNGELIEPLFHSTSGGMTEDSEDVFASALPYLRSVLSPYEEGAPKFRDVASMTVNEFITKLEKKYPNVKLTEKNLQEKIKLIERSDSGRIKKVMVDNEIVSGRDLRELFNLNSTNFKITINPRTEIVDIQTVGYGHGVGMSQWGANGMAQKGSNYKEILKHYYTGVQIQNSK